MSNHFWEIIVDRVFKDREVQVQLLLALIITLVVTFILPKGLHDTMARNLNLYGIPIICVPILLLVVIFLFSRVAWSLIVGRWHCYQEGLRLLREHQQIIEIFENLTDWQKKFLRYGIAQNKRQFEAFELGSYKICWENEMEILKIRGFVSEPKFEVYLMNDKVFDVLKAYMQSISRENPTNDKHDR